MQACSASVPGPDLCRNGFRQDASCHGLGFSCPTCGKASERVPMCMQDDVPDRIFPLWFNDSGLPRFGKPHTDSASGRAQRTNNNKEG